MSKRAPSTNGRQTAGRNTRGQFTKGNAGGPGNPHAAAVGEYRARLFKAIRGTDIDQAIATVREIMSRGKDSDRLAAARLLLDRAIGPPVEMDLIERLEKLEAVLTGRQP
jgi:hypothetical protein